MSDTERLAAERDRWRKNAEEEYQRGYDDACAELSARWINYTDRHAGELAEAGWVRLPVDCDGEPIRIGDRLDGYGIVAEVRELTLINGPDYGWVIVERNGERFYDSAAFGHHRDVTADDLVAEVANRAAGLSASLYEGSMDSAGYAKAMADLVGEYAGRLGVLGEDE